MERVNGVKRKSGLRERESKRREIGTRRDVGEREERNARRSELLAPRSHLPLSPVSGHCIVILSILLLLDHSATFCLFRGDILPYMGVLTDLPPELLDLVLGFNETSCD